MPVSSIPFSQSPPSRSSSRRASDSSGAAERRRLRVVLSWLSIVTRAIGPCSDSTRASLSSVSNQASQRRGAHPHADAERRQPVRAFGRSPNPYASPVPSAGRLSPPVDDRRRSRRRTGSGAVVRRDAHAVAPGQDLDRKRLVQLDQIDVVHLETRLLEHALGRRGFVRSPPPPADPRAKANPTMRIFGSSPSSDAARSEARSAAVAPSVSCPAELPAVTWPPARNGVGGPASPSIDVSGRRN